MAETAHSIPAPANPPAPASLIRLSPLGCPPGVEPHIWRQALRRRNEGRMLALEGLLSILDGMTADPDLEPAGDELENSWAEGRPHASGFALEDDEDGADDEQVNEDGGDILDECHDIERGGGTAVIEGALLAGMPAAAAAAAAPATGATEGEETGIMAASRHPPRPETRSSDGRRG
jgi:hypothetical protein